MIERARVIAVTVTTALTLALTGCITTPEPTPTPEPTTPPPASPTPSPTPTLSTAQEAAAATVKKFYEITDQIASTPEVDINSLYEVSGGDVAEEYLKDLQMMRVRDWRQTGRTTVEVLDVAGAEAPFKVHACVDTSAVDLTDPTGKSLVVAGSPTRVLYDFTLVTLGSPVLRVTTAEVEQSSC